MFPKIIRVYAQDYQVPSQNVQGEDDYRMTHTSYRYDSGDFNTEFNVEKKNPSEYYFRADDYLALKKKNVLLEELLAKHKLFLKEE